MPHLQEARDLRPDQAGEPRVRAGPPLGPGHVEKPRQIVAGHVLGHDEGGRGIGGNVEDFPEPWAMEVGQPPAGGDEPLRDLGERRLGDAILPQPLQGKELARGLGGIFGQAGQVRLGDAARTEQALDYVPADLQRRKHGYRL